jgi:UDP-glucose 4-epimerase
MARTILCTGGAGYIGNHTCVELQQAGYEVVVIDNLCNSSADSLDSVAEITGKPVTFYQGDIRDSRILDSLFAAHTIDAVIHFAGLKAVGESTEIPLEYYENNIAGSINLFQAMKRHDVKSIVFSSSATVYGDPKSVPIKEDFPTSATNPYGRSKLVIEEVLRDLYQSDESWKIALLRYFNPVGAHESGLIGENPKGIPNNLMPYIAQVASGKLECLSVFGDDYPTPDGTGVRDYIHVVDLAKGHLAALEYLSGLEEGEVFTTNLGTGNGYSVLELVRAFEKAAGVPVPFEIVGRRPGDIASCYADTEYALKTMGWSAGFGLERMCEDSWKWEQVSRKHGKILT